jgi:hypothetical protein
MANYKTKGSVGPWAPGTVITDEDLKKHPNLGGVARLRDKLSAIEDTTDEPAGDAGDTPPPEITTGNPVGVNEVRKVTGAADPNAQGRRPAGKS